MIMVFQIIKKRIIECLDRLFPLHIPFTFGHSIEQASALKENDDIYIYITPCYERVQSSQCLTRSEMIQWFQQLTHSYYKKREKLLVFYLGNVSLCCSHIVIASTMHLPPPVPFESVHQQCTSGWRKKQVSQSVARQVEAEVLVLRIHNSQNYCAESELLSH